MDKNTKVVIVTVIQNLSKKIRAPEQGLVFVISKPIGVDIIRLGKEILGSK
mgnify:CR=1 FL=1